jgi:UDP-3-O-[3-hydroxymyristoyl] glucosamine N-acyltransferase
MTLVERKSIDEPGFYRRRGPCRPTRDWLRTAAHLKQHLELRRRRALASRARPPRNDE